MGGDVTGDTRVEVTMARDGNVSVVEGDKSRTATTRVVGGLEAELPHLPPEQCHASMPEYAAPALLAPSSGTGSSRRKRKSASVMRRGIPSTSPRSIPQMISQDGRPSVGDAEAASNGASQLPYYCPMCKKFFSRQFSWKVHMNVHRGIFPYTCNECGKGFTSHINLKGHLVQHTNRREFKCAACGKEFIYKRGLNAHIPICKGVQDGSYVYEESV